MQDKARIQLREILSNPRTLKELGVELPQAPPPKPTASDSAPSMGKDESGMMLDILSLINGSIAGRLYKVPPEVTREAFAYDDFHRKKLAPPLERILNKWSPYVLKTYKDEVGFLMLFAGTLNVQVKTMHVLEAQRRSKNPGTAADNVTPISEARKSPEPRTQPEQPRETKTAANMLDSVGIPGIDF